MPYIFDVVATKTQCYKIPLLPHLCSKSRSHQSNSASHIDQRDMSAFRRPLYKRPVSPFGSLMANAFKRSVEEKLSKSNKLPSFYNRCVDDALTKQSNLDLAASFLSTLNKCHPSLNFTMEVEVEGKIPFPGMKIIKRDAK